MSSSLKDPEHNTAHLSLYFLTLFPEIINPYMKAGVVGRAIDRDLLRFQCVNFRDFTTGNYRSVDDLPFGGGAGMVIRAEPIAQALDSIPKCGHRILVSANGQRFTQRDAERLSTYKEISFICGRYEGVDARLHFDYVDEVFSVGDYILSGGELPAMMIADAIARLIPGVLNNAQSLIHESHSLSGDSLLEHSHYTRPAIWRGHSVPEVLLSGHHARIQEWRRAESIRITAQARPDLLHLANLKPEERAEVERLLTEEYPR